MRRRRARANEAQPDLFFSQPPLPEVTEEAQVRAGADDVFVEARGLFRPIDVNGYMPSPESDRLRVSLERFEGPLDLLLHLIEKHALDIFNIPIKTITDEYLAIVDDIRHLDLDVAGDFLVMAAQLAHIKSRFLLPREERPEDETPELDPRLELVRRLLEYQRFKDAAARLDALSVLGRDVFGRAETAIAYDTPVVEPEATLNLADVDVIELIRHFDAMLKRAQKSVVHEVLVERISVGARINDLVDFARENENFAFEDILDRYGERSRQNVIVTFLSVLEMARLKLVRVIQHPETGAITVHSIAENLKADDGMIESLSTVDEFEPGAASTSSEDVR
jgi:segregation and condensation protein A